MRTSSEARLAVIFTVFLQATPAVRGRTTSPAETIAAFILCAQLFHRAEVNSSGACEILTVGPLVVVLESESALHISSGSAVRLARSASAIDTERS